MSKSAASGSGVGADRAAGYLRELLGTWEGHGHGSYPTIDSFDYREELRFVQSDADPMFRYVVRSWRLANGREVPSHQETGFMTVAPDGAIESLNAQGQDRVEVLRGTIHPGPEGAWTLQLDSTFHGGDARMRSASRTIEVSGDDISYTLHMTTDRVDTPEIHLDAALRRARPDQ